jgi:hypothetical protein
MRGGAKYLPTTTRRKKYAGMTYKEIKSAMTGALGKSHTRRAPNRANTTKKARTVKRVVRKINLKSYVTDILYDNWPEDTLLKTANLIKVLLRIATKGRGPNVKVADTFVLKLISTLFYAFRKEDDINYNSNATNTELDEDDIYNDPYGLLKIISDKLEKLANSEDDEYKMEVAETIKSAIQSAYEDVYGKKDEAVNELSEMFSKM